MQQKGPATPASTPYARWKFGPPSTPDFFPIAVWLQQPRNAARYKQAGINLYVGLWQGPTEQQLATLREAKMSVICEQNEVGLRHREDPIIVGWMHQDEPDNAQPIIDPATGRQQGWGGPVPPDMVVKWYRNLKAKDPNRPVFLNLGQGVANDSWIGRGSGAHPDDYFTYVKAADIISYDVYPVAGLNSEELLWYVPKGLDRLHLWTRWNESTDGKKIIWNALECTRISNRERKPTPHHVRAEVWMSLIHGSQGIIYFVHQFEPNFVEAALLEDREMLEAVSAINRQIHELAPVLHSPTIDDAVVVTSSDNKVPVHCMLKRHKGLTYLFAVGMRNAPTTAEFVLRGVPARATAEVLEENRRIAVQRGRFVDSFKPYQVHLYRIR